MSASARLRLIPPNHELGWTAYVWLIFLPTFFVHPFVGGASIGGWLACIAAAVVFLVTYFRGHWVNGRGLWPIILAQVAIGVAFSPVNTGAYIMFTYAASFAARLEKTDEAITWIVAITVVGLGAAFAIDAPIYFWVGHGVFTPLIGGVNLHRAQVDRANEQLRLAHDEIEHLAAVAERERISRDLHDVLGHTLTLIVLKAELASKLAKRNPERAAAEIRDVERVSRAALAEVRDAIRGYRPTLADEVQRAHRLLNAAGVEATFDVAGEVRVAKSRDGIDEVLALALREAATNIARHSRAARATVRICCDSDAESIVLEVHDNGRGLERSEGSGLRGMRERVEGIGGQMTLTSSPGTRLKITVPLVHEYSFNTRIATA